MRRGRKKEEKWISGREREKNEKRKKKKDDLDDQWTSSEELGFFLLIPSTRPPALSVCLIVFVLFTPEKCEISFKTEKEKRRILVLFFFGVFFHSLPIHGQQPWLSSGRISHLHHTTISLPTSHPWRTVCFFHFKAKKKGEKSSAK